MGVVGEGQGAGVCVGGGVCDAGWDMPGVCWGVCSHCWGCVHIPGMFCGCVHIPRVS